MNSYGDVDGAFRFYAIVDPEGKIPTVDEESRLNDPARWYTGPIGTLAHLSDYALVFTDWHDANADYRHYSDNLPSGTVIRAFEVAVEEVVNPYEGLEGSTA